jgi:hypothetical protein
MVRKVELLNPIIKIRATNAITPQVIKRLWGFTLLRFLASLIIVDLVIFFRVLLKIQAERGIV